VTIEEDQLTWEDDKTLGRITVECLITTIQQLNQFAWIRACRSILELTSRIESDTSLCGVRDYETDLWLICKSHEGCVLSIGVQRTADNIDTLESIYRLTVLTPLKVYVIETILGIEPVNHTLFDRLYNDYRTIEVCLLVHVPDNPIYECAEEVTLTELNNLFRHNALRSELFV
jgi:hypothetical protein